jgi:four helix bundle protein
VGVRSHRDLRAWQKADAVRRRVLELVKVESARRDLAFRDQADRASASACRNLAEGFYRYRHRDFARFVTMARASLGELLESVDEARIKGYVNDREHGEVETQIQEALRVTTGLLRYLRGDKPAPGT